MSQLQITSFFSPSKKAKECNPSPQKSNVSRFFGSKSPNIKISPKPSVKEEICDNSKTESNKKEVKVAKTETAKQDSKESSSSVSSPKRVSDKVKQCSTKKKRKLDDSDDDSDEFSFL